MTDYSIAGSSGTTGLSHWTSPTAAGKLAAVDPSDTTTAPAGSAGSDKWLSIAQLLGVACYLFPSGDTSGATDAAAIAAAVTALGGNPGVIALAPAAPWYVAVAQVTLKTGQYISAPGCVINATGTAGAVFRVADTSTYSTRTAWGGGITGMPVINAGTTTGACYALHLGDVFFASAFFFASGFAANGGAAALFDNQTAITEDLQGCIFAESCGVIFTQSANTGGGATGSFDRMHMYIAVDTNGLCDGLTFSGGAWTGNHRLTYVGNMNTSTTQYSCLKITGDNSGLGGVDVSHVGQGDTVIGVELDDNTHLAPYTIFFGGGTNTFAGSGNLDWSQGFPFTSSNNAGQFSFAGPVNGDPALPSSAPAGMTNLADSNQTISSTTATAITNVQANVAAFTAYKIEIYIPHLGAGTTGTFTFGLGGPSIALASLDIELWTGTTLTRATRNGATATLDTGAAATSARALKVTGTIAFSSAGTVTVTGLKSASGSSNVTVDIGAYILLIQLAAP